MVEASGQDMNTGDKARTVNAPYSPGGSVPDHIGESLSALVDGLASQMEVHRVLKASESDPGVRAIWARYHMVSASMRSSFPSGPLVDLSAAIRDAIEEEETHSVRKRPSWRNTVVKLGVAASVAALMVVTTQMVGVQPGSIQDETAALAGADPVKSSTVNTNPPVSLPAGFQAPSISARVVSNTSGAPSYSAQPNYYPVVTRAQSTVPTSVAPSPEVQAYLQRVMEIHAGNASLNSGRGLLPYARVPVRDREE